MQLIINNNMLCRIIVDSRSKVQTQVLIPNEDTKLQELLLIGFHDNLLAAHFGFTRTFSQLARQYHWPNIRQITKQYVLSCKLCQAHKNTAPAVYNSTLKPSLPEGPNVRISIDLIGPLPLANNNYKYALVMVDYFTKFAKTAPLISKEGGEVAEAIFKNWYSTFGIPYELQNDQGTEFTNDLLKRLNDRLNIGHRITTPYYPKANGQVERFNRTLKNCIAIYAENNVGTWPEFLESVTWSYNSSLNPVIGFSPYYLMFGREPRLPLDVLEGSAKDIKHDLEQYNTKLTYHMYQAFKIVKENLYKYAVKNKLRYDKQIKAHIKLNPGDKVLLYSPQINKAKDDADHSQIWKRDWVGPYEIVKQKFEENDGVYIIKDNQSKREWTINVHHLRPYVSRTFLTEKIPQLSSSSDKTEFSRDASHGDSKSPWDAKKAVVNQSDDSSYFGLSKRIDKFESLDTEKRKHHNAFRHTTGISKQEAKRLKSRQLDKITNDEAENSLVQYEIEKIISHKQTRRGINYLIKWVGYDEPTFEPSQNIMTRDILIEYWNNFTSAQRPKEFQKKSNNKKALGDKSNKEEGECCEPKNLDKQ
jgi:hypothetical protein